MSRVGAAAAAQSGAIMPTPSTDAYLVPPGVLNNSSTVLVRSEAPRTDKSFFPPVNFNAWGAAIILASLYEFSEKARVERRKNHLDEVIAERKKIGTKQVKFTDYDAVIGTQGPNLSMYNISFGVWFRILDYLLCENTLSCVPENDKAALINSRFAIPPGLDSYPDRIKCLQSALQRRRILSDNYFFSRPCRKDSETLFILLDTALNADLPIVKEILENATPEQCQKLLSTEHGTGFATTRLGRVTVERTGTPLQMAIFDHDEEMVAFFKEKMGLAEFQRQCEAVVGADYDVFLKNQEKEATALCAGLEDAFKAARPNTFTVDRNYVASTTSQQCLRTIDTFINELIWTLSKTILCTIQLFYNECMKFIAACHLILIATVIFHKK